jgi:mannose-6-phosphate isomerase-like protein (cupin superfamily)
MEVINLQEKFALFQEQWSPKLVAELNGQAVKLVKVQGEFVWHHHEAEDELFFVVQGTLSIEFRDRVVQLQAGEMIVVPRGVEHRPYAAQEAWLMLFEPMATLNTGNVTNERTVEDVKRV